MPDTNFRPVTDLDLRRREGRRLVDVVMGRDDGRTQLCHYLIIERPPVAAACDIREIEQYRDIERLVANALDLETGDRHGKWLGAFTATYRDGKLAAVDLVEHMPVKLALAKRHRLEKRPGKAMLAPASEVL